MSSIDEWISNNQKGLCALCGAELSNILFRMENVNGTYYVCKKCCLQTIDTEIDTLKLRRDIMVAKIKAVQKYRETINLEKFIGCNHGDSLYVEIGLGLEQCLRCGNIRTMR